MEAEAPLIPVCVTLPARIENLPSLIRPAVDAARVLGLDADRCSDLELALEECLVNIANYAYPDGSGPVAVTVTTATDRLVVVIEDRGIPFDVDAAPAADLSSDIATRQIGGLGIHLVRRFMDDVRYRREGNRNRLELALRLPTAEEAP